MIRYFLTRLAGAIPTLFIIVTATFFLMRAAPGGPFDQEQTLPPEIVANLQRAYGLDQPIWTQYGRYLGSLLGITGVLLLLWPLYNSVYPVPAYPGNLWPFLLLAWLVCGALLLLARPALAREELPEL